eukprot:s3161_g7.t1
MLWFLFYRKVPKILGDFDVVLQGRVTFLHEPALQGWLPLGTTLDVVLLARVNDFQLGCAAASVELVNRW